MRKSKKERHNKVINDMIRSSARINIDFARLVVREKSLARIQMMTNPNYVGELMKDQLFNALKYVVNNRCRMGEWENV